MICKLFDVNVTFVVRDSGDDVLSNISQHLDFLELVVDRGVSLMGVTGMCVDSFDDDWVVLKRECCVNGVVCVVEARIEAPLIAVTFDILDFHMTHC